jgi:hypothetical protein
MPRRWQFTLAFVGTLTLASDISHGQGQPTDSSKLAEFLLTGWRSEREKLVTGKVLIQGTDTRISGNSPIKVSFTFDHPKGMRKYRVFWKGRYDGWWTITPELLAQCTNNAAPLVQLIKPTDPALDYVREFDPRCFGMGVLGDLDRGVKFEDLVKNLNSSTPQAVWEVNKVKDGLYQLACRPPDDFRPPNGKGALAKCTMVINEHKGFSCERFEVFTQRDTKAKWTRASSTSAMWEEQNGTWVPTSVTAEGISKDRIGLKLAWENVNEPVANDEFEIDNLGAPPGTLIADARLSRDNPIIVGKVGQRNVIPKLGRTQSWYFQLKTIAIVAANVALLGVLSFLVIHRRRRQAASRSQTTTGE